MRLKTLLLLLLISLQGFSQISVGPRHVGTSDKFKKGELEKLKKTTTIFVLSDLYDAETYNNILTEVWDVTPFKIVDHKTFSLEDYFDDQYSFADISGFLKYREGRGGITIAHLITNLDVKMYDNEAILKQKNKLTAEKWRKKREDIIEKSIINYARIYLYQKDDFFEIVFPNKDKINTYGMDWSTFNDPKYMAEVVKAMYTKDVFFNYKPGFLKNYLQKTNALLKKEEIYWMFADEFLPELKNLAKNKLYIPSYMSIKYNKWKGVDSEEDDENIHELFKDYEFDYEIIADEELSNKIMNNEELYYMRYVRMNAERFLQVVNSKTSEIVYREYVGGMTYKIKGKNIKELSDKIIKAKKK